jgi:hypothetical protein
MKNINRSFSLVAIILSVGFLSFTSSFAPSLPGSWHWKQGSLENTISFIDDYCVFVSFDQQNKKFNYTWGGPYKIEGRNIVVQVQFNTKQKELTSTSFSFPFEWKGEKLSAAFDGSAQEWTQTDNGKAPLAGVWRISGRKQGEQMSEMQLGARRTLKILTGNRFQWAAINIDTREFFGTGGGRYTFENGKYTEHIEFFSRDSSRVGASLSFDGKLENGAWHHSGLSSRGEPIYEIWKRLNQ